VTVLRANGVQAWIDEEGVTAGDSVSVHIPPDAHDAAVETLARHMEEIHALAGQGRRRAQAGQATQSGPANLDEDDLGSGPPLVMERFRQAGFVIALVLAPLLVVTLARTPMSRGLALGIVILGAVLLAALRNRSD
jgi:hypothetical protein